MWSCEEGIYRLQTCSSHRLVVHTALRQWRMNISLTNQTTQLRPRHRPVSGHLLINSDTLLFRFVVCLFLSIMEKQWQITDSYSSPSTISIDLRRCTRNQCLDIACICVMHLFYLLGFFSLIWKYNLPCRSGRALTGQGASWTLYVWTRLSQTV